MTLQAGLPRFGTASADKRRSPLAADHAMIDHGGQDAPGFQIVVGLSKGLLLAFYVRSSAKKITQWERALQQFADSK
jgi:hypothetical protein